MQRAHAQLPPRWNKRPHPLGLAVTELKATLALLILHQHALLLDGPAEEVEVTEISSELLCLVLAGTEIWRTKSKVGGCHVTVADMEDKEIELLFEQLWDIPQHLDNPPTRVAPYISH
jgi:hypothetical protein